MMNIDRFHKCGNSPPSAEWSGVFRACGRVAPYQMAVFTGYSSLCTHLQMTSHGEKSEDCIVSYCSFVFGKLRSIKNTTQYN